MNTLFHLIFSRYRTAFSKLPREVWMLALCSLINRAGTMVVVFLSLYLTTQLHFSEGRAAAILLAYGLGSMAGSIGGGKLCDRCNPITVQIVSLVGGGAAFLLLGSLAGFPAIVGGACALGLINEAYRPAVMSAVASLTNDENRLRSLALLRMAINLGMTMGPALGGFLAKYSYHWLFVADGLTCWASALFLFLLFGFRKLPSIAKEDRPSKQRRSPFRNVHFLGFLGVVLLFAAVFFQISGAYPIYLKTVYLLDEKAIGLLFTLNAAVVVVVEMLLVKSLEHKNPLHVAGLGALLVGTAFGATAYGSNMFLLIATVLLWTCGEMMCFPFLNNMAALFGAREGQGAYLGIYSATFSLAFTLAPSAGLWFYGQYGGQALLSLCSLAGFAAFVICFALRPHAKGFRTAGPRLPD